MNLHATLGDADPIPLDEYHSPLHLSGDGARSLLYAAAAEVAGDCWIIAAGREGVTDEVVTRVEELIEARTTVMLDHGAVNVEDFRADGCEMGEVLVVIDTPPAELAWRLDAVLPQGNRVGVRAVAAHFPASYREGFGTLVTADAGSGAYEHPYRDVSGAEFTV